MQPSHGPIGWFHAPSLAVHLNLAFEGPADQSPPPDGCIPVPSEILTLATLRHEKAHWYQTIGTTTGIFAQFITEHQTALVRLALANRGAQLSVADFPLLDSSAPELSACGRIWQQLEALYRWVFGGIPRDEYRKLPILSHTTLTAFSSYCQGILRNIGSDVDMIMHLEAEVDRRLDTPSPALAGPKLATEEGRVLGALDLMELGAKHNELLVLEHWRADTLGEEEVRWFPKTVDNPFFHGVYGTARRLFYRIVEQQPSAFSELVLLVLVDCALNAMLPPAVTLELRSAEWLRDTPLPRFLAMTRAVWRSRLLREKATLQAHRLEDVCEQVYTVLEESGFVPPNAKLIAIVRAFLGRVSTITSIDDLFMIEDNGAKAELSHARIRFLASRINLAFEARSRCREFFVFPTLSSMLQKKLFKEVDRMLAAPLYWRRGGGFTTPLEPSDLALRFFIRHAIICDLSRWLTYLPAERVAEELTWYVQQGDSVIISQKVVIAAVVSVVPASMFRVALVDVFERAVAKRLRQ